MKIVVVLLLLIFGNLAAADGEYTYVRSKYSKYFRSTTTEQSPATITETLDFTHNDYNEVKDEPILNNECGEQTAENHPWIAILEHTDPNGINGNKKTLSKGVLISRQHVLTTVSSIHNSHPFWVVSGVRLGDTPTWATNQMLRRTEHVQRFIVEQVFIHEYKDIALIKLDKKINVTGEYVNFIMKKKHLSLKNKIEHVHS